ncbi:MAG: hypothetical protein AB8E82_08835 [Aureispira sp.]
MLHRFFAKETHADLNSVLLTLLSHIGQDITQWNIKKQDGKYHQAYSYIAQGNGLTLSFYENALKEKIRIQKTELIIACENIPWLSILAEHSNQKTTHKKRLDCHLLAEHPAWQPWQLQSNQPVLAAHLLHTIDPYLSVFQSLDAVELVLERQRLYVRWAWLPNTSARQQQLQMTLDFARALTQALDQLATVSSK